MDSLRYNLQTFSTEPSIDNLPAIKSFISSTRPFQSSITSPLSICSSFTHSFSHQNSTPHTTQSPLAVVSPLPKTVVSPFNASQSTIITSAINIQATSSFSGFSSVEQPQTSFVCKEPVFSVTSAANSSSSVVSNGFPSKNYEKCIDEKLSHPSTLPFSHQSQENYSNAQTSHQIKNLSMNYVKNFHTSITKKSYPLFYSSPPIENHTLPLKSSLPISPISSSKQKSSSPKCLLGSPTPAPTSLSPSSSDVKRKLQLRIKGIIAKKSLKNFSSEGFQITKYFDFSLVLNL